MPTTVSVEELQRLASNTRQEEERKRKEEFDKRLERCHQEARSIAEKIIQELPSRMKEAAKRGDTSIVVYTASERHCWEVTGYIYELFVKENPGLHSSERRCNNELVYVITWD